MHSLRSWFVQSHPYVWRLAWEAVHRFSFLLPHDRSYYALRHFIAAAPDGLFLDVGANDGISALSFRKFDERYSILSIEPNRLLEPALKRIKDSDANFDFAMVGAGAVPARSVFFVPSYGGTVLHTFTSSSRKQVEQAVALCFGQSVAARVAVTSLECQVIPLDDLNLAPTIVKIDAEGFDYDVLLGLETTIARSRPFIIVEVAWNDCKNILQFFEARDYISLDYDTVTDRFFADLAARRGGSARHRNLFAVPAEKALGLPIESA